VYPSDPEIAESVTIDDGETTKPQIEVSPALGGKLVPLLLTVTDTGTPALTRYGRVLLRVEASKKAMVPSIEPDLRDVEPVEERAGGGRDDQAGRPNR
jgi:hypothetical protein